MGRPSLLDRVFLHLRVSFLWCPDKNYTMHLHVHVHMWRTFTPLVKNFLLSNHSVKNQLLYLLWPTKDRSSASSKFLAVFCNLRGQIPKVSKEQSTCMCKRHILSNRSSRVACVRCLVKCMLEIGNLQNNQFNLYLCLCSDEGLMIKMWKLFMVANLDYQVSW